MNNKIALNIWDWSIWIIWIHRCEMDFQHSTYHYHDNITCCLCSQKIHFSNRTVRCLFCGRFRHKYCVKCIFLGTRFINPYFSRKCGCKHKLLFKQRSTRCIKCSEFSHKYCIRTTHYGSFYYLDVGTYSHMYNSYTYLCENCGNDKDKSKPRI